MLTLDGLHKGAGAALAWSTPRTLLEERTDGVPKVRLRTTPRVSTGACVHRSSVAGRAKLVGRRRRLQADCAHCAQLFKLRPKWRQWQAPTVGRFSHCGYSPRCRPVCVQVVANKLVVMESGEWVLPYWREQPRNERIAGFTDFKSSCHAAALPTGDAEEDKGTEAEAAAATSHTATGVLVSADKGSSWSARGNLTDPRTALIEGTVAVLESQKLLMLLRTQTGCTFRSTSTVRMSREHSKRTLCGGVGAVALPYSENARGFH